MDEMRGMKDFALDMATKYLGYSSSPLVAATVGGSSRWLSTASHPSKVYRPEHQSVQPFGVDLGFSLGYLAALAVSHR